MVVLLYVLFLSASCSGSDEIPLERAEQSSAYNAADRAIDNDLATQAITGQEANPWLRLYFTSSFNVEEVVIEKGHGYVASCTYSVSVYEGEVKTLCGTYSKYYGTYTNEIVECEGKRGDSVMLEQSVCTEWLYINEIKAYRLGKQRFLLFLKKYYLII